MKTTPILTALVLLSTALLAPGVGAQASGQDNRGVANASAYCTFGWAAAHADGTSLWSVADANANGLNVHMEAPRAEADAGWWSLGASSAGASGLADFWFFQVAAAASCSYTPPATANLDFGLECTARDGGRDVTYDGAIIRDDATGDLWFSGVRTTDGEAEEFAMPQRTPSVGMPLDGVEAQSAEAQAPRFVFATDSASSALPDSFTKTDQGIQADFWSSSKLGSGSTDGCNVFNFNRAVA